MADRHHHFHRAIESISWDDRRWEGFLKVLKKVLLVVLFIHGLPVFTVYWPPCFAHVVVIANLLVRTAASVNLPLVNRASCEVNKT
jgi:hypothetical protein